MVDARHAGVSDLALHEHIIRMQRAYGEDIGMKVGETSSLKFLQAVYKDGSGCDLTADQIQDRLYVQTLKTHHHAIDALDIHLESPSYVLHACEFVPSP